MKILTIDGKKYIPLEEAKLLTRREVDNLDCFRSNGLEVIRQNIEVRLNGKTLKLAKKEFQILAELTLNPGKVYSRNDLLKLIWKFDGDDLGIAPRTVDQYVYSLRKKIGAGRIETVTNFGYRWSGSRS